MRNKSFEKKQEKENRNLQLINCVSFYATERKAFLQTP